MVVLRATAESDHHVGASVGFAEAEDLAPLVERGATAGLHLPTQFFASLFLFGLASLRLEPLWANKDALRGDLGDRVLVPMSRPHVVIWLLPCVHLADITLRISTATRAHLLTMAVFVERVRSAAVCRICARPAEAFPRVARQTPNCVLGSVEAPTREAISVPFPPRFVVQIPLQFLFGAGIGLIEIRRHLFCGLLAAFGEAIDDPYNYKDVVIPLFVVTLPAIDRPIVALANLGQRRLRLVQIIAHRRFPSIAGRFWKLHNAGARRVVIGLVHVNQHPVLSKLGDDVGKHSLFRALFPQFP
jgi:hypothetical protein